VQSAARFDLPIIVVVSNNAALGNVWLRMRTQGALPAHLTEAPDQDWAAFARALGCEGATVRRPDELAPALEQALAGNKACVIDVKTDRAAATPVEPYSEATAAWSYHA
jgi:acetolactate synthase-1/2/3 large subunit